MKVRVEKGPSWAGTSHERGVKELESMCNTYKDSLSEGGEPVVKPTFNDIVKLLTICGESKVGLSTY